jgi:hypothetical protein
MISASTGLSRRKPLGSLSKRNQLLSASEEEFKTLDRATGATSGKEEHNGHHHVK